MSRRSRQSNVSPSLDQPAGDSIQAAIKAKQRRIAELIKAAARAVPASVITMISDTPVKSSSSSLGFLAPPPPAHLQARKAALLPVPEEHSAEAGQESQSGHSSDSGDGLAALLGYSEDGDESDTSEGEGENIVSKAAAASPRVASQPATSAEPSNAVLSKQPSEDDMDKELASFLSQLESSGLLDGEQPPGSSSGVTVELPVEARREPEQQPGNEAEQEPSAEAEQKVLGYLAQAPDWSKVLDTGGGGVYYWNLSSNEVVWEVPEGMDPDLLLPPDHAAGAAPDGGSKAEEGAEAAAVGVSATGGASPERGLGAPQAEGPPAASVDDALGGAAGAQMPQQGGDAGLRSGAGAVPGGQQAEEGQAAAPGAADGSSAATAAAEEGELEEGQLPSEPAAEDEPTGPEGAGPADDDPESLRSLLLVRPQEHMAAVLESLATDAREAGRLFLGSLPRAVRLAIEAEVRLADWVELSAAQVAAADSGDAERGLSWEAYELHVSGKVMAGLSALPAARKEAAALLSRGMSEAKAAAAATAAATTAAATAARASSAKPAAEPPQQQQWSQAHAVHEEHGAPGFSYMEPGYRYMDYMGGAYNWQLHAHQYHSMSAGYPYMARPPPPGGFFGPGAVRPLFPVVPEAAAALAAAVPAPPASAAAQPSSWASPPPPPPPPSSAPGDDEAPPPLPFSPSEPDAPPLPPPEPQDDPDHPALPPPLPGAVEEDSAAPSPPRDLAPPLPADPPLEASADPGAFTLSRGVSLHLPDHDMDMDTEEDGAQGQPVYAGVLAATGSGLGQEGEAIPQAGTSFQGPEALQFANQSLAAAAAQAVLPAPSTSVDRRREYSAKQTLATSSGLGAGAAPSTAAAADAAIPARAAPAAGTASNGALTAAADKKRKADKPGGELAGPSAAKKVKARKEVGSKVASLMNQWGAVRKSLEAEEQRQAQQEKDAFDPEAQQRKKRSEIEQWKAEQLRSGQAEENANFQPVQGDWRKRFGGKASNSSSSNKKAAAAAAAAAAPPEPEAAAYPRRSKTKPDLDALSKGLPAGWKPYWKPDSGDIYYENKATKETSWERP